MDMLTSSIAQMNVPEITLVAALLDNELTMVAATFVLVLLTERRKKKIMKIGFAAVLAFVLSMGVKYALHVERPCVAVPSKVACPDSYSFPSGHTIVAFTVMLAFLNKPTFVVYFLYAIFIAFTRIYLGVHSFEDVAGSVALAPFVYYVADLAWKKIEGRRYAFRNEHGQ